MAKRSRFLDRWEDYCPFGDVIEGTCILPLKTPLKESLSNKYEDKKRFTPQTLIETLNERGLTLGLIIDLTFTRKYYNPEEFTEKGIKYEKIFVEGQKIPSDVEITQMFDIIQNFQQQDNFDNKYVIGIHCTHGLSRTGYMVCRYLMDVLGWQSNEAIDAFNKARHHQMYRRNFLNDLHRRGKLHDRHMEVGSQGRSFQRQGWRQEQSKKERSGSSFVPRFSRQGSNNRVPHMIDPVQELASNPQNDLKYAAVLNCPGHVVDYTKTENHGSTLTSFRMPKMHCPLQIVRVIEVIGPDDKNPQYTDLVCLPEDQVMLIDSNNNRCILLDSLFQILSIYQLSNKPRRASMFDGNKVAVTLNKKNQILLLTVNDCTITPTGTVVTRLPCYGIAMVGKDSTVVTGPNFARSKCYWSVINDKGVEMSYHEYLDFAVNDSYLALNTSKTRVFISAWETNSLFCFDIAGTRLFVYCPDNLKGSYGVTLDIGDNIYVVGKQSRNVHQLSQEGSLLQILTAELPEYPAAVTYSRTKNQLLLTNRSSNNKTIHVIKLG